MSRYELYNEKQAEFLGFYNSARLLEKGEVITFQGEKFYISELIIRSESNIRAIVWPAIIYLPMDIENLKLLSWLQKNLIGMTIRLTGDKRCIKGKVINFWPGMRSTPSDDRLKLNKMPKNSAAEAVPRRLELLTLQADDLKLIDLTDFHMIELLGNDEARH